MTSFVFCHWDLDVADYKQPSNDHKTEITGVHCYFGLLTKWIGWLLFTCRDI